MGLDTKNAKGWGTLLLYVILDFNPEWVGHPPECQLARRGAEGACLQRFFP
jgi:hypothetical protein